MFGPIYRSLQDPMAAREAAEAGSVARTARRNVDQLEAKLERALLACEALWTIVRDKLGVSDVDLVQRINELDLTDGELDGKVRRGAVSCPQCARPIARRFPKCMYCGQPVVHDPFA